MVLSPMRMGIWALGLALLASSSLVVAANGKIVHDAEYYVLEAQNGEKWAAEDKSLDARLAEFQKRNGGKPPNVLYILIDNYSFH